MNKAVILNVVTRAWRDLEVVLMNVWTYIQSPMLIAVMRMKGIAVVRVIRIIFSRVLSNVN